MKDIRFFNKIFSHWINFWVFIFCASVLSYNGHGGQAAIILLLTFIYIFFFKKKLLSNCKLTNYENLLILVIMSFWTLNLFNAFIQPSIIEVQDLRTVLRSIDNPMRWALMLPVFFLFRSFKLNWKVLSLGISLGVIISVGIAIHQVYFEGLERAHGGMNHVITFGELMVASDLILWVFMIFAWKNNLKIFSIFLFIVSLIAFYGSLLSITRGAWIVYLLLIFGFFLYSFKQGLSSKNFLFSKTFISRILLGFLIFFVVSNTSQYKEIKNRSTDTLSQISLGEYHKVTSGRNPIFKTAINLSRLFPFGVGTDNFRNGSKLLIVEDALKNTGVVVKNQEGVVVENKNLIKIYDNINEFTYLESFGQDEKIKFTSRYRHAHNEWLNVLAENGILGFVLLSLIFLISFIIFWKNLDSDNELVGIYSYAGIMLIFSYFIFAQSQSVFTSHAALMFFIFFLYLFIGQISRLNNINFKSHISNTNI